MFCLPMGMHLTVCTLSASLPEVPLQFRSVALSRKQYFLCPALTTTVPSYSREALATLKAQESWWSWVHGAEGQQA